MVSPGGQHVISENLSTLLVWSHDAMFAVLVSRDFVLRKLSSNAGNWLWKYVELLSVEWFTKAARLCNKDDGTDDLRLRWRKPRRVDSD